MQKKCNPVILFLNNRIIKYLLMMKLTLIITLVFSFQAIAGNISAQKINLELKDVSLETALKAIEVQANYRFVYESSVLPKKKLVSVSAVDATIDFVMKELLSKTNLFFKVINDKLVVIASENIIRAKIISGKILDESGNTLSGVSIIEKGTNNGTSSREDGSFSLSVSSDNSILIFTSLGYLSKEMKAVEKMVVILEKYDAQLEQVVVVGYGTQKRANLTGSVSSVYFDTKAMTTRAISNVSSALAGMASGIRVRQSNGLPRDNNEADVDVRGVGSLNISSAPLVLVDGQVASISSVSPNDVESVSILKDAASAAIYGSRASNGVILITTKTGKGANGKVTFSYNGYTGTKSPTLLPDYEYNTVDHMRLNNMALENSGQTPWYSEDDLAEWENGIKTDPLKYPSTNWWDAVIKKNIIYSHNLSARGGTDKINFYTSMDFYKDDGMIYNSGFQRLSFRNNLIYNVNKWLKLGNNISYSSSNAGPVDIDDIFQWFRAASPSIYPQAPDGRYGGPQLKNETSNNNNQLARAKQQRGESKGNRLQGKIYGVVTPLTGLSITASYFADIYQGLTWSGSQPYNLWNFATETTITNNENNPLSLSNTFSKNERQVVDLYADYSKNFNKHSIHFLGGYNQEYFKSSSFGGTRQDLLSYETPVLSAATGEITNLTGNANDYALRSFFGRANYSFDNKYLFEANLRYDGSSKFAPNKRWGAFPSASVGWIISRENFFEPLARIFTNMKLRASYGELGNNGIGNYDWQSFYSIVKYPFNGVSTSGLNYSGFGNNAITWESTLVSNIGIDTRLFNKLDVTLNYYDKLTKNILTNLPIPATNGGISSPRVNSAKVRNAGFEAEVRYAERFGKLNASAAFNFGYNKNKIVSYKGDFIEPHGQNAGAWTEGYPIGIVWIREVDHIIQNQTEIDDLVAKGYTFSPATPGPGDFLYKDANNDKAINDNDRVLKGNPIPLYTYGGSFSLEYAGFDASIYVDGVGKWDRYLNSSVFELSHQTGGFIWPVSYLNQWTPTNTNTNIPKVYASSQVNNQQSDYFLHRADYIKIRVLQLGYTLPYSVLSKIKLDKVRVFLNLENYFTWTQWPNLDPESVRSTNDDATYPLGKIASAGLQISF